MAKVLNVTELTGVKIKRELEKGRDGREYNRYTFITKIRNKTQNIRLLSGSANGSDRFDNLNLCFNDKNEADLIREETKDSVNNRTTVVYKAEGRFIDDTGFEEIVQDVIRPAQRSDGSMLESFINNVLRRKALENGESVNENYLGEETDSVAVAEENAELAEITKKSNKKKE